MLLVSGSIPDLHKTGLKVQRDGICSRPAILPISVTQLGEVGLLFHPAELYSYYGLEIRRDSPFENTLVFGYTDDFIGYLTDPNAYETSEYAAIVVPKITDLPPFTSEGCASFYHGG